MVFFDPLSKIFSTYNYIGRLILCHVYKYNFFILHTDNQSFKFDYGVKYIINTEKTIIVNI